MTFDSRAKYREVNRRGKSCLNSFFYYSSRSRITTTQSSATRCWDKSERRKSLSPLRGLQLVLVSSFSFPFSSSSVTSLKGSRTWNLRCTCCVWISAWNLSVSGHDMKVNLLQEEQENLSRNEMFDYTAHSSSSPWLFSCYFLEELKVRRDWLCRCF